MQSNANRPLVTSAKSVRLKILFAKIYSTHKIRTPNRVPVKRHPNGFMPKGVRPERYPQRPRLETAETEKRKETQKKQKENQTMLAMAMFQAMAENFNRGFGKRQEKEQEQQAVHT